MSIPSDTQRSGERPSLVRTARKTRLPLQLPDPSSIAPVTVGSTNSASAFIADDQIAARVHERIAELGESITGRISIHVQKCTITMRGAVQSPYQRLLVASCLRHVRPDLIILDRLELVPHRADQRRVAQRKQITFLRSRWLAATGLLAITVAAVWFGNSKTDAGLVQLHVAAEANGHPADGAFLTLYPVIGDLNSNEAAEQARSQGQVSNDGDVSWTTFERADGLLPGEYVVTATWSRPVIVDGELQPGPNVLAPVYESPASSPMRLTVPVVSSARTAARVVLNFE